MRRLTVLVVAALAACTSAPRDPFRDGERALLADDLAGALLAYDAVPVSHARYPEARAAAAGVERRMRRGHEVLLDGLLLRSEWRDREAITQLRRAREIWPGLPGIDALIAATEHRLELFDEPASDAQASALMESTTTDTVPTTVPVEVGPAPLLETAAGAQMPAVNQVGPTSAPDIVPSATVTDESAGAAHGDDPIAVGLIAVERRLGRGELELAVADLLDLAQQHPGEPRIRVHLVRVLHQRALVRYGQGSLTSAIEDWQRVLELDPGHRLAHNLLRSARAEAAVALPLR